jgi:hypothetical protein
MEEQAEMVSARYRRRMIPLPAQKFMCERAGATSTQVPGSHAIHVSNPSAVAELIKTAATSPKLASA